MIALGVPAALDLRRAAASHPLVGDLTAADLVAQEEGFLGARVGALVARLGEKDAATEGHTRRVAMLAVDVGERLGLARGRLRGLALGGLLHDMGKLAVPAAVLQKPGPLDDAEFARDPQAPAGRRPPAARPRRLRRGRAAARARPPRAARRLGLPARPDGRRARPRDPRPRRVRRLRRARLRPRLPLGLDAGARDRPAARRDPVRPGLRRGARGRPRAAVRADVAPAPVAPPLPLRPAPRRV